MGFPYNFQSLFGGGDDEEDPNLTRGMRNPYMMNLYSGDPDVGIDVGDPATAQYMARAKEPLPSAGMYEQFLQQRPQHEDYKSNVWQKIGAALLGLGGQGEAGRNLLNKDYNRAYENWETEAKFLPTRARAADVGRGKELEAERFGIIGQAKKRQFEEGKRKATAAEDLRAKKEAAAAEKAAKTEAVTSAREERATAASERASRSLELAEGREARAGEKEVKGARTKAFGAKEKELKGELATLEDKVTTEIENDSRYRNLFTTDKRGNKVPQAGSEDFLRNVRAAELHKRRKQLLERSEEEAVRSGLIHKLGE